MDVRRVAGERDPAERSATLGEERTDVFGNEARIAESIREAGLLCLASQVVPVVERDRAALRERDDRRAVPGDRLARPPNVALRIARAQPREVLHAGRHIAVERVVGARLIGDDVHAHAPAHELGQHIGGVGDERDAARCPVAERPLRDRERVVERRRDLVEEALAAAPLGT